MGKSRVSIVKVTEDRIEQAVRRAIELAGGLEKAIRADTKVLVKPNLFKPMPSGSGLVTDCRVTEAVTKTVLEMGPKSVVIGEGAGAGYDFSGAQSTEEAFRVTGTAEVARRLGVELRNLNRDAYEEVRIDNPYRMDRVKISRTTLDSDCIISVPVMKTHIRTLVTLGLKNMKGVITGDEKRKTHRLGLDMSIADLNSVVGPAFTVIDGMVAMEGWWDYPADLVEMGLVIAGSDAVAVDTVGAYLMGFDPKQVMHLTYLAKRQGATTDLDLLEVIGQPVEEERRSFKSAFEVFRKRYPGVSIILGDAACTGCVCELIAAMSYVREAGFGEAMEALSVVLGEPPEGDLPADKVILMGKCSKDGVGHHVRGCPPKEDDILEAICQVCRVDKGEVMSCRDLMRRKIWDATRANLQA